MRRPPDTDAARASDRARSTERIRHDINTLRNPEYSGGEGFVTRFAYTPEYLHTVDYFRKRFQALDFAVWSDPVGTLVASNRSPGEQVFGLGSHCDSVRNGGPYDGVLGVVTALEVCRLVRDRGSDIPLRILSFLEEEGSGFGQMLLGSRITTGQVTESELKDEFRDHEGRSLWQAAQSAGFDPEHWEDAGHELDGMVAWVEVHIEQGRILESNHEPIGIVNRIAGYIHADISFTGRADHAGATPMTDRADALAVAARTVVHAETVARSRTDGVVATVGELQVDPGVVNIIPGAVKISLDVRSTNDTHVQIAEEIAKFADQAGSTSGVDVRYTLRGAIDSTTLSPHIVEVLHRTATERGVECRVMTSGAVHDTMCVSQRVPAAMIFVPCENGLSHSPHERADPAHAGVAAEVIYSAALQLIKS